MHNLDGVLESLLNALKDAINESLTNSRRVRERMFALEKLGHPVTVSVDIEVPAQEHLHPQQSTVAMVRVESIRARRAEA